MKQNLTKEELEDFRHEVSVMSQIFHPNVVLFMGAATGSSNIRIVTELMSTDLETFLRKHGTNTPLSTRIRMAKDAALGMNWLHGINHIIHRDLKPANLLVDENNRVKVTDFGFVRFFFFKNIQKNIRLFFRLFRSSIGGISIKCQKTKYAKDEI